MENLLRYNFDINLLIIIVTFIISVKIDSISIVYADRIQIHCYIMDVLELLKSYNHLIIIFNFYID